MPERNREPPRFLRRARAMARVFSVREMALLKLSDLLTVWFETPLMRKTRALRSFSRVVPPGAVRVEAGAYRFRHPINGRNARFALRTRSSDVDVFVQVVASSEYADVARMLLHVPHPPKIIDAGANIGLTTLFLKCFRPDAHVLALEPQEENFRRLSACVEENELRDVLLRREGLWIRDTRLAPEPRFRDGRAWSFALKAVEDPGPRGIPVASLASLLREVGWDAVDLLKLDVEGSEAGLLRDPSFLRILRERVRILCVEIHPEAISPQEARLALETTGMQTFQGRETIVAWHEAGGGE